MATMMAGWYVIPVCWLRVFMIRSIVGMMVAMLAVSWEKRVLHSCTATEDSE